jgi:hypothetical protein
MGLPGWWVNTAALFCTQEPKIVSLNPWPAGARFLQFTHTYICTYAYPLAWSIKMRSHLHEHT